MMYVALHAHFYHPASLCKGEIAYILILGPNPDSIFSSVGNSSPTCHCEMFTWCKAQQMLGIIIILESRLLD